MSSAPRLAHFFVLLCCVAAIAGSLACQIDFASANPEDEPAASSPARDENGLLIKDDSRLADTYPHANYSYRFTAQGGAPPLHWRLEKGALPPGLKLEDNGLLHGEPQRAGEFHFAISVTDGAGPAQAVQKEFVLRVVEAITLHWKTPAHVNGSRIEGSAEVSNTTVDDVDLTFIVYAVAENGRATAIGYQHFLLHRATTGMELPFGESLPTGAYLVHVDVVGEAALKKAIYRQRLQTPSRLRVAVDQVN